MQFKVERSGFRGSGFRGLGFRGLGLRVYSVQAGVPLVHNLFLEFS